MLLIIEGDGWTILVDHGDDSNEDFGSFLMVKIIVQSKLMFPTLGQHVVACLTKHCRRQSESGTARLNGILANSASSFGGRYDKMHFLSFSKKNI